MYLSSVFLLVVTALASTAQEQSKDNLERIKQIASTTSTSPSTTSPTNEHYITERIVHSTPPHMMIMLQQKHPHVYLEVLKIKEQVMVDRKMNELKREAVASETLFRVNRDGSRDAVRSRLFLLTPRKDSGRVEEMSEDHDHDEMDWFDRLALALHLDHFWPRLLFSLSAGFAIVALGFLILHLVGLWLGWNNANGKHEEEDEYSALLNPNFRGPGVVSVHHYHDQIEKSANMQDC